jgi:hypothetical protein
MPPLMPRRVMANDGKDQIPSDGGLNLWQSINRLWGTVANIEAKVKREKQQD